VPATFLAEPLSAFGFLPGDVFSLRWGEVVRHFQLGEPDLSGLAAAELNPRPSAPAGAAAAAGPLATSEEMS
jgi:hypothetical protein